MIMPEEPEPATGILNVCVEPIDTILKSVPEYPVANTCVVFVNPFKDEMPAPTTLSVTVPDPWTIEIFEPAVNVLYSKADEALFMPRI